MSPPATPVARLLVVEDDAAMRELLVETLTEEGHAVEGAPGGRAGLERVREGGIDLVISDVKMPDMDGVDLLREIKAVEPSPHVIVVTAFGTIDLAIRALKLGAHEFITKPFEMDVLLHAVQNALEARGLRREVERLRKDVEARFKFGTIIGKSPAMQELFALLERIVTSDASVLVTGESGTGKELVARALHHNGPRARRTFLAVNCAAIPDTLLESELFGYKRGAFTDARSDKTGLFVEASGGTLFLDEIAELSPQMQAKLLRVLQEREVRPLGATRSERIDVRIIAATNQNLERRMREGSFREDLFYRLNVLSVAIPPLRARTEDILPLAEHFLAQAEKRSSKPARRLDPETAKVLLAYGWPGNVRELENVIERAVALAEGPAIVPADLPGALRDRQTTDPLAAALARGLTLAQLEREYIEKVLAAEGGNKTRAAQRLGLDRKTLYRKIEEYGRGNEITGSRRAITDDSGENE